MTTDRRWGRTMSPSDGSVEPVDHAIDEAPGDGDHDAGRRDDRDVEAGHRGDPARPRTGRVHHDVGLEGPPGARPPIAHDRALDGRPADHELLDLGVGQDGRAVRPGGGEEGEAQVERIEHAVGHLDRRQHALVEGRLELARLGRGQFAGGDAARSRRPRGSRRDRPGPDSSTATNRPPLSSRTSGAMQARMSRSTMHSTADSGSLTA